jgi:hypothetical protein
MIEHFPESHDITQTIRGRKILVMSVDIGDGRTGQIEVYEADEPEDLASEFCAVYDLNSKVRATLAKQIEDNIELLVNEVLDRPRTYDHRPQINERSRVLAYHKTKENVYARLYRQIPKHTTSQSPEKPQPRARSPPKTIKAVNIGDRLYYKGLKMKEASTQAKVELVQQRQAKEDLDLTFTPSLYSRSRSLLKYTPPDQSYRDLSESREEKVRSLKERLEKEEIAKCPFTPEVSRGSSLIASKKRISSQERLRNLYDESKRRTERCKSKAERL